MLWVEMLSDSGQPVLVNLDCCMAIGKGPDGKAVAVSLSGAPLALGELYETIAGDLVEPVTPPAKA